MRLYEWAVATGAGAEQRVSPVGVTDQALRAEARMLRALGDVPASVPACGWVTVMAYVPVIGGYDRYQTPVRAERAPDGAIRAHMSRAAISAPGLLAAPVASGGGSMRRPAGPQVYVVDGQRLRLLRREHGLSQEKLAYRAGISVTAVARLERQARASCRGHTLARLAAALREEPAAIIAPPGTRPPQGPGRADD